MLFHLRRLLARHVPFKKHLQRKFAGFPAEGRQSYPRRARRFVLPVVFAGFFPILRINCPISIAPSPASYPLFPPFNPARSIACSRVSQVSTQKISGTPVSSCASCTPRAVSETTTS